MSKDKVKRAEQELGKKTSPASASVPTDYLSWGITQLNLACYGRTNGGLRKGRVYRINGHSSAGKTFLGRTVLAEACYNKAYDDYALRYANVERGAEMDTKKFFGPRLVARMKETYPVTINDYYDEVDKLMAAGPVIHILDSMDSLDAAITSKSGDGKAKVNSQRLRQLIDKAEETGSIIIQVYQAKYAMTIGGMPKFGPPEEITSGGLAPKFYSTADVWLRIVGPIKSKYRDKNYIIGSRVAARVKKNRLSGLDRTAYFRFYPDYGIDDIGSNIDYMIQSERWKKTKGVIEASDFGVSMTEPKLIAMIEESGKQRELQIAVGKLWREIQDALKIERKPRYGE